MCVSLHLRAFVSHALVDGDDDDDDNDDDDGVDNGGIGVRGRFRSAVVGDAERRRASIW